MAKNIMFFKNNSVECIPMEIKFEHTIDLENTKCMSVHILYTYLILGPTTDRCLDIDDGILPTLIDSDFTSNPNRMLI
jgi:hypothetical protein